MFRFLPTPDLLPQWPERHSILDNRNRNSRRSRRDGVCLAGDGIAHLASEEVQPRALTHPRNGFVPQRPEAPASVPVLWMPLCTKPHSYIALSIGEIKFGYE